MIQFDEQLCGNLDNAAKREWLETNGIGGFASSTIVGLNTRRYHSLLTAATKPPVSRFVLLSKLEETLVVDGRRFDLSVNQYPGVIHPQGHQYLKSFRLDPFPTFCYSVDGVEMEKRVFLVHGENSAVIQYDVNSNPRGRPLTLEVRPLIAFRDYHGTTHFNNALNGHVQVGPNLATVAPYESLPPLHFAHNANELEGSGFWYYNFEYERERERGLDYREDLFSPFLLCFDCAGNRTSIIVASTEQHAATQAPDLRRAEIKRRQKITAKSHSNDEFTRQLVAAADQFLVMRGEQKSVIAGYPWFSDWGRDTMIALPGLTLVTGRSEEARAILLAFVHNLDQGMLPNRFPDSGEEPDYNTVDATLWMFYAVHELLRYTSDYEFVRTHLYEAFSDVISWHERGTRYGIHVDSDGLLKAGDSGTPLTWMDAKVEGRAVTPRCGKPVEIQALWYNALSVMEDLARKFTDLKSAARYSEFARRAKDSFLPLFWNEAAACLYDVVDSNGRDASIRPNQVFAISLPHTMLSRNQALQVLNVLQRELLTPFGLRTLAPSDPRYRGRYAGDPVRRDSAYHQGTVWPWLLGPFLTAYVTVHGRTSAAQEWAKRRLDALRDYLNQTGVGQIPEIFDGEPPHHPGGCIAQAWSVAETLRVLVEDIHDRRPKTL